METFTVRLHRVTKEDAQYALDSMEEIFNEYDLEDDTRQLLWEYYRIFATDVLIRFGEFDPEIGHDERNGHDG